MRVVLVAACLFITACSPTLKGATPAGGMLEFGNRYSTDEALRMAEAHCAKFGKHARPSGRDADVTYTLAFECVSA